MTKIVFKPVLKVEFFIASYTNASKIYTYIWPNLQRPMKYFVQWHWEGETFKIDIITLNLNMCQLTTETAKWVSMIAVQLWNIKLRPPFGSCKHAQMIILRYAQQWPHTQNCASCKCVYNGWQCKKDLLYDSWKKEVYTLEWKYRPIYLFLLRDFNDN